MAVHIIKKNVQRTIDIESIQAKIIYEIDADSPFVVLSDIPSEIISNTCNVIIKVPPYDDQVFSDISIYEICYKKAMLKIILHGFNKFITSIIYSDVNSKINPDKMKDAFYNAYYEVAKTKDIEAYLVLTPAIQSNLKIPPELKSWIENINPMNLRKASSHQCLDAMVFSREVNTSGYTFPEDLRRQLENIDNYASPREVIDKYLGLISTMHLSRAEITRRLACCMNRNTAEAIYYNTVNNPQKKNLVFMALASEMDLGWAAKLLKSAGYSLNKTIEKDLIYIYSIENHLKPQDLQCLLAMWAKE